MTSPNPSAAASGTVGPGRVLSGRYRLDALVASGGMAQVWRGTDDVLRRQVAVKLLHPHLAADATFVTRFRQEAVAAARLAHPGIVSIYDTCSEDGVEAIVMELVAGPTLRERLDEDTPVDPWQAAGLAAQVAEALDAAHRAGLVHRDIKPANVLLAGDGRVKVADFGIAKAVAEADLTQPGLMVGTAKYLAPEQVRGEAVDARTDLYSLGVVLYEMLSGRPPFQAESDAATALARLQRDALRPRQVRPSVPRPLEDVVVKAMEREPDDRYQSAAELRAALLAAGAAPTAGPDATVLDAAPGHTTAAPRPAFEPPTESAPPSTTAPSFGQTERSWLIPTAIVVLVALALGLAGILLGRSGASGLLGDVRDAIGGGGDEPAAALTAREATAFDPTGDGHEHDDDARYVIDGDPATSWETEGYNDRDITRIPGKEGVGIYVTLDASATLDRIEVDSPTNGWRAQVYVADAPASDLAGWGEPVATGEGLPTGTNDFDLGDATGAAVLVWITDRGDAPGQASAEIREIRVFGR